MWTYRLMTFPLAAARAGPVLLAVWLMGGVEVMVGFMASNLFAISCPPGEAALKEKRKAAPVVARVTTSLTWSRRERR